MNKNIKMGRGRMINENKEELKKMEWLKGSWKRDWASE